MKLTFKNLHTKWFEKKKILTQKEIVGTTVADSDSHKLRNKHELCYHIHRLISENGIFCDLNSLDVSEITDLSYVFANRNFRGDISKWDVSKVKNMSGMFYNSSFNGDLSCWDVKQVEIMDSMFEGSLFNQDLSTWSLSSATSLSRMFFKSSFNNKIFRVGSTVLDTSYMFAYSKFSHYIGDWDVSEVTDMTGMFMQSSFNGDLSHWNVEKVVRFDNMFSDSNFKGNLSKWAPTSAKSMSFMFTSAINPQMIKDWNLNHVDDTGMFYSKPLYCGLEEIASTLFAWLMFFSDSFPEDFIKFGLALELNGKYYHADILNSPFDSENWYMKLTPISLDIYRLQLEFIKSLAGKNS